MANQNVGIVADNGSMITDSTARNNGDDGIYAGSGCTVRRCTARGNTEDGIQVSGDCTVAANTCNYNGNGDDGAGIYAIGTDNRIEDNLVTDNDRGIEVDFSGNIIVRNTASGNTTDYDIASRERYGKHSDQPGRRGCLG